MSKAKSEATAPALTREEIRLRCFETAARMMRDNVSVTLGELTERADRLVDWVTDYGN